MKQLLSNYIKNIGGWTTPKKIVCFAVDDYGNVRVHNAKALEKIKNKGIVLNNRFDYNDSLCNRVDFKELFGVLDSVRDKNNKPAIFTSYALSANIDFDKVADSNNYVYELLPSTYKKLAKTYNDYEGAWDLLMSGIESEFIKPQFHGREHLNVRLFEYHLSENSEAQRVNLQNHSYTSIPKAPCWPTINYNESFSFWSEEDLEKHIEIIKDGLTHFEKIYGYKSITFTPPGQQLHPKLYNKFEEFGIISIDKPRKAKRHLGNNKFTLERNKLGLNTNHNYINMVRNVVFEPTQNIRANWVDFTFSQVEAAFRLKKPAIISSHRVNFCGNINPENREKGLCELKKLLQKIVIKYPEVEFMSVDKLAEQIRGNSSNSKK